MVYKYLFIYFTPSSLFPFFQFFSFVSLGLTWIISEPYKLILIFSLVENWWRIPPATQHPPKKERNHTKFIFIFVLRRIKTKEKPERGKEALLNVLSCSNTTNLYSHGQSTIITTFLTSFLYDNKPTIPSPVPLFQTNKTQKLKTHVSIETWVLLDDKQLTNP